MKIVARMSEAISGGGARVVPDVAALIRATSSPYPEIKKADRRPAILQIAPGVGSPGGAEHSTRAKIHFFFDFLAFFALAFFAFFAFLAIVSSQGFMDWTRHRGMLGGGPASQHPRWQSHQIRRPLPRAVMALSSRYPQLLCILMWFFAETRLVAAVRIARIMLNDVLTSTIFINSKPRFGLAGGSQGPL